MEDTTEAKQNYLREEIIDKKYDPEAFIGYMGEQRENGADINIWSYADLQEVRPGLTALSGRQALPGRKPPS